jgi:hypothetical protein
LWSGGARTRRLPGRWCEDKQRMEGWKNEKRGVKGSYWERQQRRRQLGCTPCACALLWWEAYALLLVRCFLLAGRLAGSRR